MSEPSDTPNPDPAEAAPAPDGTTPVFGGKTGRRRLKSEEILPFDFRQPTLLTAAELRRVRLRCDEFARQLGATLSSYLRTELGARVTKLQTAGYQKHVASLPGTTHLTLFKTDPLKGICLLDLAPRLGLMLVERLLGGPGQTAPDNRDLSDIESALLDEVVLLVLKDWCVQWAKFLELQPSILGHETNPKFLHTSPRDTVLLVLTMEMTLGDFTEALQLAFPYPTLEPLIRHLAAEAALDRDAAPKPQEKPRWKTEFSDIPIAAAAQWHGLELSVRALTALKTGDVLMLGSESSDQVVVSLANAPKYRGRLGTCAQKWAIELTEIVPS